MKEPAEGSEKQYTCSGKNPKNYLTFSFPIEKEVARIDKKGKKNHQNYILQITIY